MTGWRIRPGSATAGPVYCCYGCRFAAAVVQERGEVGRLRWQLTRLGLAIFFSLNVMMFTLVLWSLDVYADGRAPDGLPADPWWDVLRYLGLVFTLPVVFLLGGPLLESAWQELRGGRLGTDLLLVLGVAAAMAASAIAVFRGEGPVYFEIGCAILVAVTLGRWLEATGKWKATDALKSLARLLPETVRVVAGGEERTRALAEVRSGDLLRVLPGERFPVDGRVERGQAAVDEQLVTGESQPVVKSPGERVFGGTLNLDGDLLVVATASAGGGALQRLIDAVAAAAGAQGRWQRLADRVAAWFIPLVFLLAGFSLVLHLAWHDFQTGLLAALSLVLIACPCALGVATPLAVWVGMGAASRRGVLFRDGDALARLADVRAIAFDKTGTLTTAQLHVEQLLVEHDGEADEVWQRAAALAGSSAHVASQAILARARQQPAPARIVSLASTGVQTQAGRGLSAAWPETGELCHLGSLRLMEEVPLDLGPRIARALTAESSADRTHCLVGWEGEIRGLFLLREALRPEAIAAVDQLRDLGIEVQILTGDRPARAARVARELGVTAEAGLLPEEKLARIEACQRRFGTVAMVGDGINDAPALAAADVGIALGCGADISREIAEVCLVRDDLSTLGDAIRLARATRRTIRQNLVWAFAYNLVGIGLAMVGWLNPIVAAAAMIASSVLVISSSLRLAAGEAELDARAAGPAAALGSPRGRQAVRIPSAPGAARDPLGSRRPGVFPGGTHMTELPLVLLAGLLGSSHCVGMCGGFALAIGGSARSLRANLARQSLYSAGRIFTYTVLGGLVGYGGMRVMQAAPMLANVPAILAVLAGGLLVWQGLAAAGALPWQVASASGGACLAGTFFATLLSGRGRVDVFLAGLFTGLLPCGLVYAMLALAASSGSISAASLTMLAFGLGTVPIMVATGCGGSLLSLAARRRLLTIAAWCVVVTGAISIGRGVSYFTWPGVKESTGCPFCLERSATAPAGDRLDVR